MSAYEDNNTVGDEPAFIGNKIFINGDGGCAQNEVNESDRFRDTLVDLADEAARLSHDVQEMAILANRIVGERDKLGKLLDFERKINYTERKKDAAKAERNVKGMFALGFIVGAFAMVILMRLLP